MGTPHTEKGSGEGIFLFGAGGHAKSVIGVLEREQRWNLVGLLDDDPKSDSVDFFSIYILSGQQVLGICRS